ncbi:MAG: hypothetical protein P4M15_15355 [Alphaproteobacteria bacterium]|nr:hypothetical protein [Alphaproteobacteria bacterium]
MSEGKPHNKAVIPQNFLATRLRGERKFVRNPVPLAAQTLFAAKPTGFRTKPHFRKSLEAISEKAVFPE